MFVHVTLTIFKDSGVATNHWIQWRGFPFLLYVGKTLNTKLMLQSDQFPHSCVDVAVCTIG